MISLKEFKGFTLSEENVKNTIGGNFTTLDIIYTNTGNYKIYTEWTDSGEFVDRWTVGPNPAPQGEK